RALLADVGSEALVFITADHGHVLQERGVPVDLDSADDVGYRAARVRQRVDGANAARVFQIPAQALRHAGPGWYVFPRPGHALRDRRESSRPFRPTANYRHGGLTLFEVAVPLVCLKHRAAKAEIRLVPRITEPAVAGRASFIEVSVA